TIQIGDDGIWSTKVAPGAYYLFTDVNLDNPNIGTSTTDLGFDKESSLVVFPNPANQNISLLLKEYAKGSIKVIIKDINGKTVMNKSTYSMTNEWQERISISHLETGMYIIQLQTESLVMSKKFMKL
ncbi:MAG: T9SS type A sorting domain-containing protein, partial [Bacteroidales bacterium]|nr:T9SS type A sorting domain-containing protein [Bacteroidales bacterium]